MAATNAERILAEELCQLTPAELDSYILSAPVKLSYSSRLFLDDMYRLAGEILRHESLGDAIARMCGHTAQAQ